MKSVRKFTKSLQWIRVGFMRSFQALSKWMEARGNRELQKKRGIIGLVAFGAAIALGSQQPQLIPVVILVAVLGVFAWWGSWPHEEMTMKFSDFQQPVLLNGEAVPGAEVLRKYVEAFPKDSVAQLAERLSKAPGAPQISEADMEAALDAADITVGVTAKEKAAAERYDRATRTPPPSKAAAFMKKVLAERAPERRQVAGERFEVPEVKDREVCPDTPPREGSVDDAVESSRSVQVGEEQG